MKKKKNRLFDHSRKELLTRLGKRAFETWRKLLDL